MSLIEVDTKRCVGDGACTEVCPLGLLELTGDEPKPVMSEEREDVCVRCGHCVAVCLSGALTHSACPTTKCEPLDPEWRAAVTETSMLIRARRSVRRYRATPIAKGVLRELIAVARYAPTGQNAQSVRWLVVYDPARVRELAEHVVAWMRQVIADQPAMARALHLPWLVDGWDQGRDMILRGAPHLILAYGNRDDGIARLGSTIALTTFELAAQAQGLGTCWAGYVMMLPAVEERLGLPEGHQLFGAMMVGAPAYEFRRIPVRREASLEFRD